MHKRIILAALMAAAAVVSPARATVPGTCSSATFTGNGVTTAYAFSCRFLQNGDLSVTVAGVTKTQGVDYSVTGAGNASGTITFAAAPANGAAIVITRTVDYKQLAEFRSRTYDPTAIGNALDKLAMGEQQLQNLYTNPPASVLPANVTAKLNNIRFADQFANIQAAITDAGTTGAVIIPSSYAASDTFTNPNSIPILDLRGAANAFSGWEISVKAFGAVGNNSADDTGPITTANTAAAAAGVGLFFPPGTYRATNLTHSTSPWRGIPRQSIIKAKAGGDTGYLVASPQWLAAGATSASAPWQHVYGLDFDGAGLKTYTVVMRTYFTKVENCWFRGSTDTDLLVSSDARDATALTSTMVNDEFVNNWFGQTAGNTAIYNFRTIDSGAKVSDLHFIKNFAISATTANVWGVVTSGWLVSQNHCYGAPSSFYMYKPSVGTRFLENYAENEVRFGSAITVAGDAVTIGPGNYFASHVWADFNSVGNHIVSTGNTYSSSAELRHAYFDPSKVVVSTNDTFRNATPFKHYASAGGAVQDVSTGKFQINGSFLAPVGRLLTVLFDGSGSAAAGIMHRQASWDNAAYQVAPGTSAFAGLGTPPNGVLLYCTDCTIANPCAGAGTGAIAKRLNGVWVCN